MESENQRNKFITSLPSFLCVATPQVVGCLWVSTGPLSKREKPFEWFNYLFDGVLESQIHNFPTVEKSIYKTDQFGKTFHLLHIEDSFAQIDKAYQDFVQILAQERNQEEGQKANEGKEEYLETPQILLLTQKPKFFESSLKKRSSKFEHLEYFY